MSEDIGVSDDFGRIAFDGRVVVLSNGAEKAVENRTKVIQRAERRRKVRLAPVVAEHIVRIATLPRLILPEIKTCPTCGHELDDEN